MTFPTPPTPPTPPARPKVVLEGGGSVTDMPRPKSFGPTSDKDINEQKAKDHVAHGGGALSKTTTTKADDTSAEAKANIDKANQNQESKNQANQNNTANTERPQIRSNQNQNQNQNQSANNNKQIDVTREFSEENTANEQITTSTTQPFQVRDSGHGVIYWGFTIISVGILLAYLAKNYLFKKSTDKGFSKRDISYLTEDKEDTKQVAQNVEPPKNKKIVKPQKNIKQEPSKQESQKQGGHFEVRI